MLNRRFHVRQSVIVGKLAFAVLTPEALPAAECAVSGDVTAATVFAGHINVWGFDSIAVRFCILMIDIVPSPFL